MVERGSAWVIERKISSVVITGPTGAIGLALCRLLAEEGILTYAVCRPDTPRAAALPEHERIVPVFCDVSELEKLPRMLPGKLDAFYHFAWINTIGSGRNDMPSQIRNIQYTIDAVRCAAALGCGVFIGAGSQAEYGRVDGILRPDTPCFPENGYGMAKLCASQMSRSEAQRLGLEHVWARVLSVYGPGDGPTTMVSEVIRQLKQREIPELTAGEQVWDYLYSCDAARAFWLLARHGISGRVYPMGSGQARLLREYVELLRDAVDPELPLGLGRIPYSPLQIMRLEADISALRDDTGFTPQISFGEGIRETIQSLS